MGLYDGETDDDTSIAAVFAAIIGVFLTIIVLGVILIAILYKTNPRCVFPLSVVEFTLLTCWLSSVGFVVF